MGKFESASLWQRLCFLFVVIGFGLELFAFVLRMPEGADDVEALVIGSFLAYLTALVLVLLLVFMDDAVQKKAALISLIVFSIAAGALLIVAVGVYRENYRGKYYATKYFTMFSVTSSVLAVLGGVFAILEVAGARAP